MTIGEWNQRILCPDGSCVGLIGPDGTCKICRRASPNWGDERKRGLLASDAEAADDAGAASAHADLSPSSPSSIGSWSGRQLCSDGACIGVVGERGVCGTCGRPGPTPAIPTAATSDEPGDPADADDADEADGADETDEGDEGGERALCPDGACVGLLGDDRRCKICGAEGR